MIKKTIIGTALALSACLAAAQSTGYYLENSGRIWNRVETNAVATNNGTSNSVAKGAQSASAQGGVSSLPIAGGQSLTLWGAVETAGSGEAEAILGVRGEKGSFMEKTIVPAFLAEMDGLTDTGAIVVLATNRASSLDPAVTREGRMDRKVRVERPKAQDALKIMEIHLKNTTLDMSGASNTADANRIRAELLAYVVDAIYHPALVYYDVQFTNGQEKQFTLADLTSGAMLAGIIDGAASTALRRDLKNGGKPTGIRKEDLIEAIRQAYRSNLNVAHDQALIDFAGDFTIANVTKRKNEHVAETA